VPNVQQKTPDDGQRGCPKRVEFYNRINLNNLCVWLVTKKKFITMHGLMNVKLYCTLFPFDLQNTITYTEHSVITKGQFMLHNN